MSLEQAFCVLRQALPANPDERRQVVQEKHAAARFVERYRESNKSAKSDIMEVLNRLDSREETVFAIIESHFSTWSPNDKDVDAKKAAAKHRLLLNTINAEKV